MGASMSMGRSVPASERPHADPTMNRARRGMSTVIRKLSR